MTSRPFYPVLALLLWSLQWLGQSPAAKEVVPSAEKLDFWSLRPIRSPAIPVPTTEDRAWSRNPVDFFIGAKLRSQGLTPSPEAERRILIRRLFFDLIGLPPTPEQVDAFQREQNPDAYERLVDQLLASPRYGERWARYWLDLVHYGDTHGYDKDKPRPNAWPYRDYVIRAHNADKPFAQFVLEQIAGDVLFPHSRDGIEATGFIAAGPWDFIGHVEVPESKIDGQIARNLDRDDMVANTMSSFTSLTAHCARCHDHKFDPVTQGDYYSLQAVFAALDRADRAYDIDPAIARQRRSLTQREQSLRARHHTLSNEIARMAGPGLVALNQKIAALQTNVSNGLAMGRANPGQLAQLTQERDVLWDKSLSNEMKEEWTSVLLALTNIQQELAKLPAQNVVYAGTVFSGSGSFAGTGGKPRLIRVLHRGDVTSPRATAHPGTVPIVPGARSQFELAPDAPEGERRAALARWIIDPQNPLTWRSIVNRIWQHHMGRGIVGTANDFGRMGEPPTHPELLDWLAVNFQQSNGSLKRLHRLIVTSATYRQSSAIREDLARIDEGNIFYWRMNRRRLQAEEIRDAVLQVAGRLDDRMYGPGFQDFLIEKPEHSPHYEYHLHDPEDPRCQRRAIYRFLVRSQPDPFMTTLDCADPSQMVARRNETLTALQALALFNNKLILTMSRHFAHRVRNGDASAQIREAFRLALGRECSKSEMDELVSYRTVHGLANCCRLILNLNEFLFID